MAAGGGAGGGYMGRGGGPDAGSMSANAFGGTSGKGKDVQEAKNQLMGVISVEEAQRNPQNAIATPASPTGYVSKYGGYGIAKGIESSLIGAGVLDPKYGPTAPPVVVGGYNPNIGPHYSGPVRDISPRSRTSSGVVESPWGVNPKQPGSPAIPEEEIDFLGLDFFDDVVAPALGSTLGSVTTKSALDAFKNSTLGQLLGAQTATDLATGVGVGSAVYGMGQALKGFMEDAGFNVTEEGPSKKGEIPGADVGPSMNLNFQGMEGVSVDPIGNAVFDLSRAFVSNYDNPVSYNNAVIDAINNLSTASVSTAGGDPTANVAQREASERREAAAKVAAQKAAEQLIIQNAARNNNVANISVPNGPPITVKVSPPKKKRILKGKEAANYVDPGPSPAQIAAASVVADQAKFKTLPKRIQQELRSGKQPTGSDYDVDRALALLKPPAPPIPRAGTRAFIEGGYGGGK